MFRLLSATCLVISVQFSSESIAQSWASPEKSSCVPRPSLSCKTPLMPFFISGISPTQTIWNQPAFWPYNAALFASDSTTTAHICGGIVIGPYAVLTAAHCIETATAIFGHNADFIVILGASSSNYDKAIKTLNAHSYKVVRLDPHPFYQGVETSYSADLAVLTLEKPINSTFFRAACIPSELPVADAYQDGDVVGFGQNTKTIKGGVGRSPNLKHIKLPVMAIKDCERQDGFNSSNMFCAGFKEESGVEPDACLGPGDAGDGFVVTEQGNFLALGIVSKGDLKCPSPVYFVRLPRYRAWIEWRVERNLRKMVQSQGFKLCPVVPEVHNRFGNFIGQKPDFSDRVDSYKPFTLAPDRSGLVPFGISAVPKPTREEAIIDYATSSE